MPAKAPHDAPIHRVSADYAIGCLAGKFEWLPRCAACWWCVGVRPILENSTACQKSMPSLTSFYGGGLRVAIRGRVFLWLIMN
jgi:hypothetical protein